MLWVILPSLRTIGNDLFVLGYALPKSMWFHAINMLNFVFSSGTNRFRKRGVRWLVQWWEGEVHLFMLQCVWLAFAVMLVPACTYMSLLRSAFNSRFYVLRILLFLELAPSSWSSSDAFHNNVQHQVTVSFFASCVPSPSLECRLLLDWPLIEIHIYLTLGIMSYLHPIPHP